MEDKTPEEILEHFKAHPWCAKYIEDPNYQVVLEPSDVPKEQRDSTFFGKTLSGDDRIRATLQLNKQPDDTLLPAAIQEIVTFWDLGSGMNGYIGVAHGGFISALLDHHTGSLIFTNHIYAERHAGTNGFHTNVTVSLNIRFQGIVKTPSIILVRSKITKLEPRKMFILGTVENEQGKVLATADALFVTPRVPIGLVASL